MKIPIVLAFQDGRSKRGRHCARERGRARGIAAAVTLAAGLTAAPAASFASGYELERTTPGTLAVELGVAVALGAGAFLLPSPVACGWCAPPAFDEALHHPVAPANRIAVAGWSHAIAFFALPVGGMTALVLPPLLGGDPDRHAAENAVIFAEAFTTNAALTIAVKKAFARKRPAFYYRRSEFTEFRNTQLEPYLSFFSGDTSSAFVSASTASTLAFMRGYPSAPYVTGASAVLAVSAGLMRIGADVHWPSDVFMGAVVGTSVGIAIPLLLHSRSRGTEQDGGTAMQPLVSWGGAF